MKCYFFHNDLCCLGQLLITCAKVRFNFHSKGYDHLHSQEMQQQSFAAVKPEIQSWLNKCLRDQKNKIQSPQSQQWFSAWQVQHGWEYPWTPLMVWGDYESLHSHEAAQAGETCLISLSKFYLGFWQKFQPGILAVKLLAKPQRAPGFGHRYQTHLR